MSPHLNVWWKRERNTNPQIQNGSDSLTAWQSFNRVPRKDKKVCTKSWHGFCYYFYLCVPVCACVYSFRILSFLHRVLKVFIGSYTSEVYRLYVCVSLSAVCCFLCMWVTSSPFITAIPLFFLLHCWAVFGFFGHFSSTAWASVIYVSASRRGHSAPCRREEHFATWGCYWASKQLLSNQLSAGYTQYFQYLLFIH